MFTPAEEKQEGAEEAAEKENLETEEISEDDVHTMPQKFLDSSASPKKKKVKTGKKGGFSWIILGVIIVVALGAIIFAVFIFLSGQTDIDPVDDYVPKEKPNVNINNSNNNNNDNSNQNQNNNVNQAEGSLFDLNSVSGRDQQRLKDIADIRSALVLYYTTYQVFPSSLNSLVDRFLSSLPENPAPGGENYEYIVAENQLDYRLNFNLEEGGNLGILNLDGGDYYATLEAIYPESFTAPETNEGNSNVNSNVPEESVATSGPPSLGLDSDGDQLTDIEENVYETNSTLADTDGDGFTDSAEILSFYDPKVVGGRLMDSGLIEVYQNEKYNYSLLYPKAWAVRSLSLEGNEIIFSATTGEFVQILTRENTLGLSVSQWYLQNNPGADLLDLTNLTIDGFPAIQTTDGLTTYFAIGGNVYIISYNIGNQQQMNFYTTYQLFLKSFLFIEPEG